MIIWGTYVTKKVISTGQFYCPGCSNHRNYKLRRPKKWGHLYWIPIIPMDELERYVECDACKGTYREVVLQHDPIRAQREFEQNVSGMLCQVMSLMANERTGKSMRLSDLIAGSVRDILKVEMTPASIRSAVGPGPAQPETVLTNVERQASTLSERGKDLVLRAAVLAAPKPLTSSGHALAAEIGRRLGMMPAHVNGVLAEFRAN